VVVAVLEPVLIVLMVNTNILILEVSARIVGHLHMGVALTVLMVSISMKLVVESVHTVDHLHMEVAPIVHLANMNIRK
jgi:hypothetical protein